MNDEGREVRCPKKHREQYVQCKEEWDLLFPLDVWEEYIGQTGRWVNDRLRAQESH